MFAYKVKVILENEKWNRYSSPNQLLEAWNQFVDECELGYDMGIYEYDNDLSVRNIIEKILQDEALSKFEEYEYFKKEIFKIDERFRKLLSKEKKRTDKRFWWERGILNKAGKEYF